MNIEEAYPLTNCLFCSSILTESNTRSKKCNCDHLYNIIELNNGGFAILFCISNYNFYIDNSTTTIKEILPFKKKSNIYNVNEVLMINKENYKLIIERLKKLQPFK